MKCTALAVCLALSIASTACEGSKFAGAKSQTQSYQVKTVGSDTASTSASDAIASSQASTVKSDTSTKSKGGSPHSSSPDSSDDAKGAITECSELTGIAADAIKIAGSENDILLDPHQAFILRETGNQNTVDIDFKATAESTHIKAICIFVAGNENKVNLKVANHIDSIFVVTRGNQASIAVTTVKGSVIDSINMDSKGNGGALILSGEGQFPCAKSNPNIQCK